MKTTIYITILLGLSVSIANAQATTVTTYSSLEIGYDVSKDLPLGVKLGVNGQVYIQDDASQRTLNSNYLSDFMLWVEKGIVAEDLAIGDRDLWLADYVFAPDYKLPSLEAIKAYTETHKHLPGVIGQKELEAQGYYRINEMLIGQLKNIEELLLHTIAQEKEIKALKLQNENLKVMVDKLEKDFEKLQDFKK